MSLLSDVEASVRAGTDHDTDTQVTQAQIFAWVNEDYQVLVRRLANSIPDRYTAISPTFTIASGNSQDLAAAPTSLTDFSRIRAVQLQNGVVWGDLPLAPDVSPETMGYLSFRQRGISTVDFFPTQLIVGQTFRVKYVYRPPKLTAGANVLDLPDGGEQSLIALCGGRIRHRLDDDPSFFQGERQRILTELVNSLLPFYMTTPQGIIDISGRY